MNETLLRTILVIEPDAAMREKVAAELSKLGVPVLEAARGQDGLYLLRTKKPALVLMHWACPDLNGTQLEIYARSEGDIPVVFASWSEPGRMIADLAKVSLDAKTFRAVTTALRKL